jgi:hypothetical protein
MGMGNDERPGDVVIVRCKNGGLFETRWVRGASFKAVRLGRHRFQRCPVHRKLELIQRVEPSTLSRDERAEAAKYPAGRVI